MTDIQVHLIEIGNKFLSKKNNVFINSKEACCKKDINKCKILKKMLVLDSKLQKKTLKDTMLITNVLSLKS